MLEIVLTLKATHHSVLETRRGLVLENLALRHQLAVLTRPNRRPRFRPSGLAPTIVPVPRVRLRGVSPRVGWPRLVQVRSRCRADPPPFVPPVGHLGRVPRRKQPHIYSDAELTALLRQASLLLPCRGRLVDGTVQEIDLMGSPPVESREGVHVPPQTDRRTLRILTAAHVVECSAPPIGTRH